MSEISIWYTKGQLNALRAIMWRTKGMCELERKLTKEQFDEIADYILSQAPTSEAFNELQMVRYEVIR